MASRPWPWATALMKLALVQVSNMIPWHSPLESCFLWCNFWFHKDQRDHVSILTYLWSTAPLSSQLLVYPWYSPRSFLFLLNMAILNWIILLWNWKVYSECKFMPYKRKLCNDHKKLAFYIFVEPTTSKGTDQNYSDLNLLQTKSHSSWHKGSIDSSLYLTTHL